MCSLSYKISKEPTIADVVSFAGECRGSHKSEAYSSFVLVILFFHFL